MLFDRPGRPAVTLAGAAATVERVLEATPGADYVHLACQGQFDGTDPEASGLQLAGNRYLTVSAIVRGLRLQRTRLVTLSACETAIMVDVARLPDEFVGLAAAFLIRSNEPDKKNHFRVVTP